MININKLDELLEEYKIYGFNDESFSLFIKRTKDDGKRVVN